MLAWRESLWHLHTRDCWGFLRNALVSCLPGVQWLRRLRRLRPRPWLTAYARSCMPADDDWSRRVQAARRPSQFDILLGPYSANDSVGEIFHASRCGVELRHPYRDRRLVEFMLAIPASQLYRRGRYKYMLRNAMRTILPDQIRRGRNQRHSFRCSSVALRRKRTGNSEETLIWIRPTLAALRPGRLAHTGSSWSLSNGGRRTGVVVLYLLRAVAYACQWGGCQ